MIAIEIASPYEAERILKFLKRRGWKFNFEEQAYLGSAEQLGDMGCIVLFSNKEYGFMSVDSSLKPTTWTQKLQRRISKGLV